MDKYRFLIGWMSESDSNGGEANGIESQDDLAEHGDSFEFELPTGLEEYAWRYGASYAFEANFTAHDSLSYVEKWDGNQWVAVQRRRR